MRRALRINPEDIQAQALLAGVQFSVHEFRKALATARPIVDKPSGVQALATVGDAYLALGDYARARSAYADLMAWAATRRPTAGLPRSRRCAATTSRQSA